MSAPAQTRHAASMAEVGVETPVYGAGCGCAKPHGCVPSGRLFRAQRRQSLAVTCTKSSLPSTPAGPKTAVVSRDVTLPPCRALQVTPNAEETLNGEAFCRHSTPMRRSHSCGIQDKWFKQLWNLAA
jgi:hypothetical protein